MTARYVNTLKAEFGKVISAEEANEQFVSIEAAMACLEELAESIETPDLEIHNYGPVMTEEILDPGFGNMQKITVEGNVILEFADPDATDPKVIFLLIADGGNGSFTFGSGSSWATNSNGSGISGVPWDNQGLGGDYGAVVICIHDGFGWLYLTYARNSIDFTAAADTDDLYDWR